MTHPTPEPKPDPDPANPHPYAPRHAAQQQPAHRDRRPQGWSTRRAGRAWNTAKPRR